MHSNHLMVGAQQFLALETHSCNSFHITHMYVSLILVNCGNICMINCTYWATISCTKDAIQINSYESNTLCLCGNHFGISASFLSLNAFLCLTGSVQQSENSFILVHCQSSGTFCEDSTKLQIHFTSSHCCESNYHLELLHMGG